jgi:hypothetical protein
MAPKLAKGELPAQSCAVARRILFTRLLGMLAASIAVSTAVSMAVSTAVSTAGCAPSAEDPLSRLSVAEPETGEYRLRYLEPPWELVMLEGTTAFLRIPSSRMTFGGVEGGPGKYELTATVERGAPATRIEAEERAALGRGETVIAGPRTLQTRDTVVGVELLTTVPGVDLLHRRIVFLPVDAASVLRLAFVATPELDTPEVDAMIATVGVGLER